MFKNVNVLLYLQQLFKNVFFSDWSVKRYSENVDKLSRQMSEMRFASTRRFSFAFNEYDAVIIYLSDISAEQQTGKQWESPNDIYIERHELFRTAANTPSAHTTCLCSANWQLVDD